MSETLKTTGEVLSVLGNNNFRVRVNLDEEKTADILCYMSGKMRQFKISVIPGDTVHVEVPHPYDAGRITYREK